MAFGKSISGTLIVEFTSAVPEKTLDALTQARIPLSHVVQKSELTYQMLIHRKDYPQLLGILRRQGNHVQIIRKRGLFWNLKAFAGHRILMATFLILILSSFYLPSRIFFVAVEGNGSIPDRLILSAAEDCGIRFGASRKLVRSEKVKNALLSAIPQLQWAGINTSGCSAIISVRERIAEGQTEPTNIVSNLIADRDGYVLSSTITSGTAHFLPGDTVTKGQLLISGYTDCGLCIRATRAKGEILAQTSRCLKAIMPAKYHLPGDICEMKYKISLLLGKKRINLWKDSRISDTGCGRMYEEYFVSLPGGFQLPIAICVDQYQYYEAPEAQVSKEHAQIFLQQFSEDYLTDQMIAGQIIQSDHRLIGSDDFYLLESDYICSEMIGIERREQIGVSNGKRN